MDEKPKLPKITCEVKGREIAPEERLLAALVLKLGGKIQITVEEVDMVKSLSFMGFEGYVELKAS